MAEIRRCLVVEDHEEARDWLEQAATEAFSGARILGVATLAEARALIAESRPDMALIDIGLPDGSGLDLVAELSRLRSQDGTDLLIVVSTVLNDDQSIFDAIRRGADGYLLKEEPRAHLVQLLHGIREGQPPLSAAVARKLLGHFRLDESDVEAPLAPREREVLQLIARGFTVAKVAELLDIRYYTAAGYVKEIYRKLNVNSRAEATLEASRRGLI